MRHESQIIWVLSSLWFMAGCAPHVPIVTAAYKGDLQQVKNLIVAGADVNQHGSVGDTIFTGSSDTSAIMIAADKGYAEIVKLLLETGRVDKIDTNIAMNWAAFDSPETLKVILDYGVPIDEVAITLTVRANNPSTLKVFLDKGADVNGVYAGQTLLIIACDSSSTDVVKMLIEAGADVNKGGSIARRIQTAGRQSMVSLINDATIATSGGPKDVALNEISKGMSVSDSRIVFESTTPLKVAKKKEIRKLLLDAGAKE